MRQLPGSFTMHKDGTRPSAGDWFRIQNKKDNLPAQVYIYDEIGFWGTTASDFVTQLTAIDADEIHLHINSPGGEIFDGLAIYNAIKSHPAEVTSFVDGLAASAASWISLAGDTVKVGRNAQMMIHDGIAICFGNASDMRDTANLLDKFSDNIADIYAQHGGGSQSDWRALMQEEMWYTGQEAVDAGLADETFNDVAPDEKDKADNKWDLSFFNYAGRGEAPSPQLVKERVLATNRKETTMAKAVKNDGGTGDQPPEGTDAPVTPPAEPAEPATEPEVAPVEPAPAAPAAPVAPENKVTGVLVNGVLTTDMTAIQNHVTTLETAIKEGSDANRTSFVEGLSSSNKIPATQVDSLTALALSLSDEQFATWSASYESVPSNSLFAEHGPGTVGSPSGATPVNAEKAKTDRISTLEGVVAMHRRTMSDERVKETKSYKELQQLLAPSS